MFSICWANRIEWGRDRTWHFKVVPSLAEALFSFHMGPFGGTKGTSYRETVQLYTKNRSKAKWDTVGEEETLLQGMVEALLISV